MTRNLTLGFLVHPSRIGHRILHLCLLLACFFGAGVHAGVTTLVTHGYNSGSSGWLLSLASAIEAYPRRHYLNGIQVATVYKLHFDSEGYPRTTKLWEPPGGNVSSGSGDIIIILDWNPYSGSLFGSDGISTRVVGPVVADALLSPTLFQGLGFAPARFPLHLVGHSRGGSLVCEISKRLGERNVVVDHLTLLDPHPLNNDGFSDIPSPIDGTARSGVYENVLFCDSYYQVEGTLFTPNGTFVDGAYIRYLGSSSISTGGYGNPHSNAHLWYHGTVAMFFPLTSDTESSLNLETRRRWYAAYEGEGATAGYYYSKRGGGNRRDSFTPIDRFNGRPVGGLHGGWIGNLGIAGGGVRANLVRLGDVRGNIVDMRLTNLLGEVVLAGSKTFAIGGPVHVAYTNHMSGDLQCNLTYLFNGVGTTTLEVGLDDDENWSNGVRKSASFSLPSTGGAPRTIQFSINDVLKTDGPGRYRIGAVIASPSGHREFYSPEILLILPPLSMEWTPRNRDQGVLFDVTIRGLKGRRYALQRSEDLQRWENVATGNLSDPGPDAMVGLAVWNGIAPSSGAMGFLRTVYLP